MPISSGKARVTHHHAKGNSSATTGTPQDIHSLKLIVWPVFSA